MNYVNQIFKFVLSELELSNLTLNINTYKLNSDYLEIIQIVQGKLELRELYSKFDRFVPYLFQDSSISLFIGETDDSSKIVTFTKFEERKNYYREKYDDDEKVNFKLSFKQSISLPLPNKVKIVCYFDSEIINLIEELVDILYVSDLQNINEKINITGITNENYESSIFELSEKKSSKKIEDYILSYISLYEFHEKRISAIPNLMGSHDKISEEMQRTCILDVLSNLFDNKVEESLLVFKQSIKKLNLSDLPKEPFEYYSQISDVVNFVFNDSTRYREKLVIVKNILYDSIDEENVVVSNLSFWNDLLNESSNEYELFVDGKVNKFISEKKEIIKEQFSMSKEINNQISDSKKSLMNNLLSIIGIFLSKFFIDAISNNNSSYSDLAYKIAFYFSGYLIIMYFFSGEFKIYKNFNNRVKIMNTYYPKLYLTKDNIIKDLKESISNPEISQLKSVNIITGGVYFLIFLFFMSKSGYMAYIIDNLISPYPVQVIFLLLPILMFIILKLRKKK